MSGHSKWKNIQHKKEKTDAQRASVFTKIGKEMAIAIKAAGPDPVSNTKLRDLIAKAKSLNVPNDNIDRIIKKFSSNDATNYEEIVYEGYAPHGIAVLVETATDNNNRTVANVRSYFNKFGGSLGTSGSVDFMFDRKCVFNVVNKEGLDMEELELEMIDYGVDEIFRDEDENVITIYGAFESFGDIQKYLEANSFEIKSGQFERIPTSDPKKLTAEQKADVEKLLAKLEEDDDVQNVYHTMDMAE